MSEGETAQGEEVGKSGRSTRKRGWKWLGIGVLLLVLVAVAMPPIAIKADRSLRTKETSNIKKLILACRIYASDRDSKFPETLQELYPDYMDTEVLFEAYNPETRMFEPYLYFPGRNDSSFSRSPLVASPLEDGDKRVVGFAGGHVIEVREEDFQRMTDARKNDAAGSTGQK